MAKSKTEYVVAKVTRGFRLNGQPVFPAKADEKGKVNHKVIKLEKRFAMQLEAASKVEICKNQNTKTNTDMPKQDGVDEEMEALAKD
jgi:hypothetical protein